MSVLEHCDATNPAECNCCDHAYDAGRFRATVRLAKDMRLPWKWTVHEALERPLTQAWLAEHFLSTQQVILNTQSPRWENFPIRHAVLALAVIQHAPWTVDGRKGAAWAAMRTGMTFHHWQLNPDSDDALIIVAPGEDFWETYDDIRVLAELLDRAYMYLPRR